MLVGFFKNVYEIIYVNVLLLIIGSVVIVPVLFVLVFIIEGLSYTPSENWSECSPVPYDGCE